MAFVEDDVARHLHTLSQWVENAVGLLSLCIPDEDTRLAAIDELTQVV